MLVLAAEVGYSRAITIRGDMKLNGHFKKYLSNIEPGPKNIQDASEQHTVLRRNLEADKQFGPDVLDTFLVGSYARDTAVKPIKDVDIIVVVTESAYADSSPAVAFKNLKDALNRCGYRFQTEDQRRSIRIELNNIDLDVVIARAPNGLDQWLLIPDRKLGDWIETNPKGHTQWAEDFNARTKGSDGQGRFKPLVKMLKAWKGFNLPNNKRPKGFTLECIAGANFGGAYDDWADVFASTLRRIGVSYSAYLTSETLPPIPDPGRPGHPLQTGLTFPQFRDFMSSVKGSIQIAEEAIASGKRTESVTLWRKLLGPDFPIDDEDGAEKEKALAFTAPTLSHVSNVRESPPFA